MSQPIEPIVFEHKSARCELVVWDDIPLLASLSEVHSAVKGQGHATRLLNDVIDYADKNGLTIASAAQPYGDEEGALSFTQLINFYKKFGFVFADTCDSEYGAYMERKPQ
jgi:hypothetical protein